MRPALILLLLTACGGGEGAFCADTANCDPGGPGTDTDPNQPADPDTRVETFGVGAPVDLLLVVDNSAGMELEQLAVATATGDLLAPILGTDLHVGVVSTDMDSPDHSGRLQGVGGTLYLDDTFADDPAGWLDQAVRLGGAGSGNEAGRDAARAAIEDTAFNSGFYRDEARLALVFVSDENDTSHQPLAEFEAWLDALKGESVFVAALVTTDVCGSGAPPAADYLTLATDYGGLAFPVCDPDLGPELAEVGAALVPAFIDGVFTLAEVPDPLSVAVTIDGAALTVGADFAFNVPENAVVLTAPPAPGAQVEIQYEVP